MKTKLIFSASIAFAIASCTAPKSDNADNTGNEKKQIGVDLAAMDTTAASPCNDFWNYANGTWLANNPVPKSETRWGSFTVVQKRNNKILRKICEEAQVANGDEGSNMQKIGDYYTCAMDSNKLNTDGIKPVQSYLDKIDAIKSSSELELTGLELAKIGVYGPISLYIGQDAKESETHSVHIGAGNIGLPDRDYYLKDAKRYVRFRSLYVEHVTKMLKFSGYTDEKAGKAAKAILKIETQLAEAMLTREERRDPEKTYNKMGIEDLKKISSNVSWKLVFDNIGIDPDSVVVSQPAYLKSTNSLLAKVNLEDWKSYIRWHFMSIVATKLSDEISEEDFDFYKKILRGQKERKPRWKRALGAVNGGLGEVVGQEYVKVAFREETKARLNIMVDNLLSAFKERLADITWMSDGTKDKALDKLNTFNRKLAYPDKWKDYSSLKVTKESYVGNYLRANRFEFNDMMAKYGKPVDHSEWGMSPQTINAYYHPLLNEIVFPAAILQPPFLNPDADDAVLYGTMGAVIGHEFTHGFDDMGSKFDAQGKMANWWTSEDREKFMAKANLIVDQYNNFEAADSAFVNGQLTLGENIADLGGLTIAFQAYQTSMKGKVKPVINGFTAEERFFISFAQVWKSNITEEFIRNMVKTNPHAPAKFRVIGTLSNMPEFHETFGCSEGDLMYKDPAERASIW